ncbi:unnamed protein product [Cylindrotheca closterium]|uniref:Glycosyltransferase family 92 protein n=1 Tax=Cylindrotheca closterium TaxID=2856 RepID=A0AAD2JM84_9STRA|nr:unnamed protein product [Cylindrotheca closterium]
MSQNKKFAVVVSLMIIGCWNSLRKASRVLLTDDGNNQEFVLPRLAETKNHESRTLLLENQDREITPTFENPLVSRVQNASDIPTNQQQQKQAEPSWTSYDASQEPFGDSFSSCLIWMDDYQQLGEWIAYHYHVLPLRYLVFFRDPKSQLDPKPIFDKWKDRIHVEYWANETDFMTKDIHREYMRISDAGKRFHSGQNMFYHACLGHLQQHNRTWTVVIDTDEYLSLDSANVPNVTDRLLEPGAALNLIKRVHARDPSTGITDKTPEKWFHNCTSMGRIEYTSYESPTRAVLKDVPSGIDPYRLVTLRFRHAGRGLIGKSIVDVSHLNMTQLKWKTISTHKMFRGCLGVWGNRRDLMYVGHYLGSVEGYQRPSDYRVWINRTQKLIRLNGKSGRKIKEGKGDDIRPWIQGFAKDVGVEKLRYFLGDVGFPLNPTTAMGQLQ